MSFSLSKSVNFGASQSGLSTIGYTLINPDGSVQQSRTTSGITELSSGTGVYGGVISFPDSWSGFILWDTGTDTPYYASENFDYRSYNSISFVGQVPTYTYIPTSSTGMIRNLIGDVGPIFALSDAEISGFLSMTSGDFFMAASLACARLAASQIALSIIRKAGNFMQDMTSLATNYMKLSDRWAEMANNIPCDAQAEVIYTDFNYNQLLTDKTHRGEPFDSF